MIVRINATIIPFKKYIAMIIETYHEWLDGLVE